MPRQGQPNGDGTFSDWLNIVPEQELIQRQQEQQLDPEQRLQQHREEMYNNAPKVQMELNEKDREHALSVSSRKIAQIDRLIGKTGTVKEEDKNELAKLELVKNRQLSNVLINDEKRSNDSKEMRNVKDTVMRMELLIAEKRKDEPVSGEELVRIEDAYARAIEAARIYLSKRHDKSSSPKYVKVRDAMKRMLPYPEMNTFWNTISVLSAMKKGQREARSQGLS